MEQSAVWAHGEWVSQLLLNKPCWSTKRVVQSPHGFFDTVLNHGPHFGIARSRRRTGTRRGVGGVAIITRARLRILPRPSQFPTNRACARDHRRW